MQFIRHRRTLGVPLSEVCQPLAFAAAPEKSCYEVNNLLNEQNAQVQRKREAFVALEHQLVA